MQQPITSVPIPNSLIDKLHKNGYRYVEDVFLAKKRWLRNAANEIKSHFIPIRFTNSHIIFKSDKNNKSIPTMSESLDLALGNGIKLGTLTEICSLPGKGKTQLCLQLCVSVQIPIVYGGLEAQSIYIDTGTNFVASRLKDMIIGCKDKLLNMKIDSKYDLNEWEENAMNNVYLIEAFGKENFCSTMILLEQFLELNPKIKLIVIDNIALPFKSQSSETERTGILNRLAVKLKKISVEKNIAIVLTNEMSTRIGLGIVSALGDAWAHCVNVRVNIALPNVGVDDRSNKETVAKIQITKEGIRDC